MQYDTHTTDALDKTSIHTKSLRSDYAGNGKHFPIGTVAVEAKTTISGNLVSSSTITSDFKMSVSHSLNTDESLENLEKTLCEKYSLITIDDEVIGEPRLAATRMTVSNVLTAFTLYDSIEEIIDEYEGRYTEKQLKDAVRFARDFLDSFYTS